MDEQYKYKYKKISKKIFFEGVKERLRNDVGIYFELLDRKKSSDLNFQGGFWGSIRLLMPVIESVANVLLKKTKYDTRPKGVRFLEKYLKVEYPYLTWVMYRHTLMHNDELQTISSNGKMLKWGVVINDRNNHAFLKGQTLINVKMLYKELDSFLEKGIYRSSGNVVIKIGLVLKRKGKGNKSPSKLINEFDILNR